MAVRRVCGLLAALTLGAGLTAQDVWTSASGPTAQDLWGVCHGAGQFVAVGKGGTILTSPDGQAWTLRTSGTTEWLTAVTRGAGRYIAVGEGGLILSSPDAVSWSRVTSPTVQRLNAVVHELGSFLAVGEQNVRLWSEDGAAWYTLENRGKTNWLRGVAYAQGGLVMVGERGYFSRSPSRKADTQAVSGELGGALEGVAGGAGAVVMVGGGGAIWRWPDPQMTRPEAVASGVTNSLGAVIYANAHFVATAGGGMILTSKDGSAWQTRAAPAPQSLRALAASDRALVAVGLGGAIVRSEFVLFAPTIVVPPKAATHQAGNATAVFEVHAAGSAPLSYQWLREGVPLAGATEARLILPEVSQAAGGSYAVQVTNAFGSVTSPAAQLTVVTATLPTGLVDEAFSPQVSGDVHAIAPLTNGLVLIGGNFSYSRASGAQQGIARLTASGEFDSSFDVGAGIAGGSVTTLALQPDGKVLAGGTFTQVRGEARARLVRLEADGSVDPSFAPPDELAVPTQMSVLADGRIVVADGSTKLRWLRTDGTVAQAAEAGGIHFARFDVRPSGAVVAGGWIEDSLRTYGRIAEFSASGAQVPLADESASGGSTALAVRVLANGDVLLARAGGSGGRFAMPAPTIVTRLGAPYLTAPRVDNPQLGAGAVWLQPDGRAVLSSRVSGSDPLTTGPVNHSLLRFNVDGSIDDTFLLGPGVDGNIHAMAGTADGSLYVGGSFTSVAGVTQPRLARLRSTGANPTLPRAFVAGPRYIEIPSGETIRLRGQVAGTGPLRLRWQQQAEVGLSLNSIYVGSSTTELNEVARDERWSGYYSLLVEGPAGTALSDYVYVKVVASKAPVVTRPMISQRAYAGRGFVLGVGLEDYTGVTYQWYRNGVAFSNATGASFTRDRAVVEDAGFYEVVVTNALGSQRLGATLEIVVAPTLINVATRAPVASESQTLIVGFVMAASPGGSRATIIRGVGPGLERFGVQRAVSDPRLAVFDAAGRQVAANDNWQDQAGATFRIGEKGFPLVARDAGVNFYAGDGAYTAQINGVGAAQGVALAEIYEDDYSRVGRIVNLSSRAFVGTGENILIPGFVLEGEGRAKFLIRGIGPALTGFGVEGGLANPTLRVLDRDGGVLATNDDWGSATNTNEIMQAAARSGAFALPTGSRDAAILLELPAGSYTVQLSGVGGTTGVGLVEVYEVP